MRGPNGKLAAVEAAADVLLGGAEGAVFDGIAFGRPALIASAPERVIEGGWEDWGKLEECWQSGCRAAPEGGLAGWFDYQGNFRFGVFPSWSRAKPDLSGPGRAVAYTDFRAVVSQGLWIERVRRAQEYIAAGDIYQVNLTHTLTAPWEREPGDFFLRLRKVSPAPCSAFLRLGDTAVVSASPESFVSIDGSRILTRPIKGTRVREHEAGADAEAARELLCSAKERAELVMITDLERSDLGQVCAYGSVKVTALCALETFEHVHHLVSTVEGTLRDDVSTLQALRACYPGGSITGAPKKRAREIIAELEESPRGIYTGALGFIDWRGRAVFSIAIRTLVVRAGLASYGVGAGIVADSDPRLEYEETLHKAAGLFAALR
jgi:anthranilate/para-aminobenzoate synthase component I